MLNLSAQNILLNNSATSKDEAIRLVAQGLVANGNVAEGYEAGMLVRETQTSTFLGNGIAIPHGTLDTRDLVKNTGVQVLQFPNGVEWGEGNIAHVVIGIAAKSDEHLSLLRQLTTVLGDEATAEKLAKTQNLDEFIALLSGKRHQPLISAELVSLNNPSDSLITLSAINAAALQEKGYVNQQFISNVVSQPPFALGNDFYLADSYVGNLANGIALARSSQGKTLITISCVDNSLETLLKRLADKNARQQLSSLNVEQILALFGQESAEQAVGSEQNSANEGELEATFTIKNEHGLHARPSAVLVNEVKKYNATIQVQNLDRDSQLVSAKSLMKIVALGVQKGHRLRFVATGEEAQKALDGIGAAIEAGLGE